MHVLMQMLIPQRNRSARNANKLAAIGCRLLLEIAAHTSEESLSNLPAKISRNNPVVVFFSFALRARSLHYTFVARDSLVLVLCSWPVLYHLPSSVEVKELV